MGLPGTPAGAMTVKQSETEFVYSQDTDVRLAPALAWCGWVRVDDPGVISVGAGAARVTVRGMNAAEKAACRDAGGEARGRLRALHTAVCAVGKVRSAKAIADWVEELYLTSSQAADLLALLIFDLTNRVPLDGLRKLARSNLKPEDAVETPEVAADGDSKSDE